jgi:hypothetical protein
VLLSAARQVDASARQTDAPRVISPAPRAAWEEILAASQEALAFQTPAWMDCLCEAGGYRDVSALYDMGDNRRLILPMAQRAFPGGLTTEASLPFGWGTGGFIAADPILPVDVARFWSRAAGAAAMRLSVRPNPREGAVWSGSAPASLIVVPRTAHVLSLEGGFDEVWAHRFEGTARTAVRKAEKSSLVVEHDDAGRLLPVFYDLYQQSIDRWATQQHEPRWLAHWRGEQRDPLRKFQSVARHLGPAFQVWVAWHNGEAAAAIIVLRQGRTASYWRGAMHKELAGPTRANYLLHRQAMEAACADGCTLYHLGETGSNPALAQFKTRFGAEPHAYAEYHRERVPITRMSTAARQVVKRLLRFRD